jgi:hypothetical protein
MASTTSSRTRGAAHRARIVFAGVLLLMLVSGCHSGVGRPASAEAVRAAAFRAAAAAEPSPGDIHVEAVTVEGTSAVVQATGTVVDAQDLVLSAVAFGRALDERIFSDTLIGRITLVWGSGEGSYVQTTHTAASYAQSVVFLGSLRKHVDALRYFQTAEAYRWLEPAEWEEATSPEGGFTKAELPIRR